MGLQRFRRGPDILFGFPDPEFPDALPRLPDTIMTWAL